MQELAYVLAAVGVVALVIGVVSAVRWLVNKWDGVDERLGYLEGWRTWAEKDIKALYERTAALDEAIKGDDESEARIREVLTTVRSEVGSLLARVIKLELGRRGE